MDVSELIYLLLIGALAGWIGGMVIRGGSLGLLGNIVVGVIGAVIGGWLFDFLGIDLDTSSEFIGSLITAAVGAVVLLWIAKLVSK